MSVNSKTLLIILFICAPIIIACSIIYYQYRERIEVADNAPIHVKLANTNFDISNIIGNTRFRYTNIYNGIAISKNNAVKIDDYNEKFCDNKYCYYVIQMFTRIAGSKWSTTSYYPTAITLTYTINGFDYKSYGYKNISYNSKNDMFGISCYAIDCKITTVSFFAKNYILIDINESATTKISGIFVNNNNQKDLNTDYTD